MSAEVKRVTELIHIHLIDTSKPLPLNENVLDLVLGLLANLEGLQNRTIYAVEAGNGRYMLKGGYYYLAACKLLGVEKIKVKYAKNSGEN